MEKWEVIKWLSGNLSITNILLAIIAFVLITYLAKSSDWLRDKFQKKNAQVLQVEQFYRENSGQDLKEIFAQWLKLFNDMGNDVDEEEIQTLVEKTTNVASKKTMIILTSMLQHIYQNNGEVDDSYVLIVYFASIVDSLKEDFTAERVGTFVLIQSKINDFIKYKGKFKNAYKIYKKEIRRTKRGIKMPLTMELIIVVIVLAIILALVAYFINKM